MDYWKLRDKKQQEIITNRNIEEVRVKIAKEYTRSMKKILGQFEKIYQELLLSISEDRPITEADLYKLDTYWEFQAQLANELESLGNKEGKLLSQSFQKEYEGIYNQLSLKGSPNFNKVDISQAKEAINKVWLADGKNWSSRVWNDKKLLINSLNENLIHCALTGKKTSETIDTLRSRFGVSFNQANTLIRTEMCHIQTESAKKRYEDYGLDKYQILVDVDERTCPICKSMDNKIFYLKEMEPGKNAPPFHPNDRCCIVPVID